MPRGKGYKEKVVNGRTYYISPTGFQTPHLSKMLAHVEKHKPVPKPVPVPAPARAKKPAKSNDS